MRQRQQVSRRAADGDDRHVQRQGAHDTPLEINDNLGQARLWRARLMGRATLHGGVARSGALDQCNLTWCWPEANTASGGTLNRGETVSWLPGLSGSAMLTFTSSTYSTAATRWSRA